MLSSPSSRLAYAPLHRGDRGALALRPALSRRAIALVVAAVTAFAGLVGLHPGKAHASTWSPASTAISFAMQKMGTPYKWGGTGSGGYDCSGLTQAAYRSAGVTLPRIASSQYYAGKHYPLSQAKPGDLVFWASNTHSPSTIYHVAIWISKNRILAAPKTGDVVKIEPIWTYGLMPYVTRPAASAVPVLNPWPQTWGSGTLIIQERLRANGYNVRYTGHYDTQTRAAVTNFQHRYAVPYDHSTVQWRTWMALFAHGTTTRVS